MTPLRYFQKGFNFRQDGPGNRLVWHLQGCNLHCPWCSNPEGMPHDGGTEIETDELVGESARCRKMFFGGGGVTFTGGEATCQREALVAALHSLREIGIHTALETNGTSDALTEVAQGVDFLIMDFKHVDATRFKETCGAGFQTLERNYGKLAEARDQLLVRIPLIHGFNADDATSFADYFASRPHAGVLFEFLRYHEYGKGKWKTPYAITDGFVSDGQYRSFTDAFNKHGLEVTFT